jgi:type II secretory pathway pseudopilin PulG
MHAQALPNNTQKLRGGYTLIETAILLVFLGIIFIGLIQYLIPYYTARQIEEQKARTSYIKNTLADFVIDDPSDIFDTSGKRLPCPASPIIPYGTAGFGVEDCTPIPANTCSITTGICNAPGTDGTPVLIGAIPTSTIGIKGEDGLDIYKSRYLYAVTQSLTNTNAMSNLAIKGAIQVNEPGGTITNNAPFVILSHGRNKIGANNIEGINANACGSSIGSDNENCDGDAIFFTDVSIIESDTVNNFDDLVAFRFKPKAVPINYQCGPRTFLTGLTAMGPICQTATAAGLVRSMTATANEVADICVDPSDPTRDTRSKILPIQIGGTGPLLDGAIFSRFMGMCGARYCQHMGYSDGMLKELGLRRDPTIPGSNNVTARCSMI